ncbi:MAG TPA: hypothetical protein VGI84_08460, partial [Pseudonocardiaceae bacterium]
MLMTTTSTRTAGTRNDDTCTAAGDVAGLLTRVSQNDPAAWEEIIRRYSGVVFAKIRSFRLQDADALDAA